MQEAQHTQASPAGGVQADGTRQTAGDELQPAGERERCPRSEAEQCPAGGAMDDASGASETTGQGLQTSGQAPEAKEASREDETRGADTAGGFTPPTLRAIEVRCQEMSYPEGTAEAFYNYQVATGWRAGRKPMQDWQRALAYWVSRTRRSGGGGKTRGTSPETKSHKASSMAFPETVAMRLAFEAYYRERTALSFCWSEREHKALTELRDKIRQGLTDEGLPLTPEATTQNFRLLLSIISDPWILKNLSLSIINTKYNEIRATYAQQQRQGRQSRASYELDEIERAADAILRASGQRHASPYAPDYSERH